MTGDLGSRNRKWRNDQQGEKAGQAPVRVRNGRPRKDSAKDGKHHSGERKSSGEAKPRRARGASGSSRPETFRRRKANENYYLTKTPPFWPFHFSISGKLNDKATMEGKGVKEDVVLRLCSGLNTPSPLPDSLTLLIETNARLYELYGDSHPWRYKHTLTAPPLSVSSPCYPNTQIDVVGVSVVEWVPIPLRPTNEELQGIVESASFAEDSISVAFVNVGEYSTPDQRRLSACCMVKWEKDGFLIELQVCCQTYFSVREVEENGEKRIELMQSRKGQAYISGYRGFSTEVPDEFHHQIWESLLPHLNARSAQMLNLRRKVGVHILGDFDSFEMRKRPTVLRTWTPLREEKVCYDEEFQDLLGDSNEDLISPPVSSEESLEDEKEEKEEKKVEVKERAEEQLEQELKQEQHQEEHQEEEQEQEQQRDMWANNEDVKGEEEESSSYMSSMWKMLGGFWGAEDARSVDQSGVILSAFYKSVDCLGEEVFQQQQ